MPWPSPGEVRRRRRLGQDQCAASHSPTGRATTTSTARPTIRSTLAAPPGDHRAAHRQRLPPAMGHCRSAPTSAAPCGRPRTICGVYAHKPTFGLVPSRGHTPPPFPPLPFERDLAVIGPMSRSAFDLSDCLTSSPAPTNSRLARLSAAAAGGAPHRLKDFRILVIDSHPLMPTASSIRAAIDKLAGRPLQGRRQGRARERVDA